MSKPRSMMQSLLNPLKGWPDTATLDIAAPIAAAALASLNPIPAGRVMHLNADGEMALGCQTASNKVHMPLFTFHWSDDPDVSNEGGITGSADDDPDGWLTAKRGNMMGIVATAGVELQSTEYADDDYEPGDPLQATTANKGVISKGTLGTDMVIGTVSRGVKNWNQLKKAVDTRRC